MANDIPVSPPVKKNSYSWKIYVKKLLPVIVPIIVTWVGSQWTEYAELANQLGGIILTIASGAVYAADVAGYEKYSSDVDEQNYDHPDAA